MPLIQTEFACPVCQHATGALHRIVANAGELVCTGNGSHKWNDHMAFMEAKPVVAFKVTMSVAPQEGHVEIKIKVPAKIKTDADAKWGDKMSATVAAILSQMVEGDVLMVNEVDLQRIKEILGKRPDNSSELYGMIWAQSQQVIEAKQERDAAIQDVKAYEGMSPGRVVIDLGTSYNAALALAKDRELPLREFLQRAIQQGLEGAWF